MFELELHVHENEFTVTIQADGKTEDVLLKNQVPSQFPSYKSAVETAKAELAGGRTEGEIIARIIENPIESDGTYFWYVAFCKSENNVKSVLINESGKVVAKRTD